MHKNLIIGLLCIPILLSSCLSYKEIVNFQDGADLGATGLPDSLLHYKRVKIKTDDIISVAVYSYNKEESARFNALQAEQMAMVGMQGGGSNLSDPFGYQVDINGDIELPIIGKMHVMGLSIEEVKDMIYDKVVATKYLTGVSVQVRFLSFRVTMLGEVTAPGSYIVQRQEINLLEALGLAGDVTIFSNRSNILVIRKIDGKNYYGRLNIKSKDVFNNPFFNLKPDDIVYVEPHKNKILSLPDPATRYIGVILGVVTLGTLLFSVLN